VSEISVDGSEKQDVGEAMGEVTKCGGPFYSRW